MSLEKRKDLWNTGRSIVEVIAVLYAAFTIASAVKELKPAIDKLTERVNNHETRITVIEDRNNR